jgi:pimeloyl-ACP methyl ester carboxylesterase
MMYVEVDGHKVFAAGRLVEASPAPPVVFVHGAAMDHSVWAMHTRYFMHIGRSVIAPDMPAHGRSGGEALTCVEAMSAWLVRCLDALGIHAAAVAGHSMGALVALETAASHASRVERLALLGVSAPMTVSDELLEAARENRPEARDMMMLWGHGFDAQFGSNPVAGIHVMNTAIRLLERARPGILFNDLNACNSYLRGVEAAQRVAAPTTIICGTEDKMTPYRASRDLAGAISNCSIDVIDHCGHILMGEQPEQTHRSLLAALG